MTDNETGTPKRNLLKELREFFGMSAGEFTREYKALGPEDKEQLKKGIENGTLTY